MWERNDTRKRRTSDNIDLQTDSHTNGEDNGRKSWPPRREAGDNSCWRFCTINTGRRIIVHISVKAWRIDMKGIKRVILYPLVVVFRVLVLVLPSSTSEFASEERRFFNSVALFCGSFLSGKLTSNQAMSFHKFQFLSVPGLHEIPLLRFVCWLVQFICFHFVVILANNWLY